MSTTQFAKHSRPPGLLRAHTHDRTAAIRLVQSEHRSTMTVLQECRILLSSGDTEFAYILALEAIEDVERHMQMDACVIHHHLRDILHQETFARRENIDLQIRHLLSELHGWHRPDDAEGRVNLKALRHLFCQHVKLEEGLIFHELACSRLDWLQLRVDLLQCKEELSKEIIVVDDSRPN